MNNKKRLEKPLFAAVPSELSDENGRYWTVTGSMPFFSITRDLNRKSWIPMVIKQVCEKLKLEYVRNSLDPSGKLLIFV